MSDRPYSIGVFCGARVGRGSHFAELARLVGELIASRGWRVVYGGGGIGLMGHVAEGVLGRGGAVLGIIPQKLIDLEQAHPRVKQMVVVGTMAERKDIMMRESDDFLILPGGIGTLDELFEVLTAFQLHWHGGRAAILNQEGFFDPLIEMLRRMVAEGFWRREAFESLLIDENPTRLLDRLGRRSGVNN
ncbi:MAG: TIGR00730 family Rossman fold protein [Phycisphaeraceae bacterium]|nr:TIGR00730 family Rossman fold protein [Phycisphaeraceae bacterium]MCW5753178.1 TIGR00730 family Rossman fold protein [Phycisphaeraceae bacterium]